MRTNWDYTRLAAHYDKRADYSKEALDELFRKIRLEPGAPIADLGAGTGKLTRELLARGFEVFAVEPNDEMRRFGRHNTESATSKVRWFEGTGEASGLPDRSVALVSFGSSFNVTDRPRALAEAARLLRNGGWFVCLWNHRDLDDPLQRRVEETIKSLIPEYSYGTRREDQAPVIDASGLFEKAIELSGKTVHVTSRDDYMDAWRSHATLERQARDFPAVIAAIERVLDGVEELRVPYTTRGWYARLRR